MLNEVGDGSICSATTQPFKRLVVCFSQTGGLSLNRLANLLNAVSGFANKLRLEFHCAYAINFAVDIVIAINQANVFNLGANFHDQ